MIEPTQSNFRTRSGNPEGDKSFVYLDFYPVGYPIGVAYIYIYRYINIYTHKPFALFTPLYKRF